MDFNNHNPNDPRSPFYYDPASPRIGRTLMRQSRSDDGWLGVIAVFLVAIVLALAFGPHDHAVLLLASAAGGGAAAGFGWWLLARRKL